MKLDNNVLTLYVGFGIGDITPPFPAALQGQSEVRFATSAENPLLTTAIVLETKSAGVQQDHSVWVSLDTSILSEELQDTIGAKVAYLGIDPTHVFVSATHTHDAPFLI